MKLILNDINMCAISIQLAVNRRGKSDERN
jgi:hypothetical protein